MLTSLKSQNLQVSEVSICALTPLGIQPFQSRPFRNERGAKTMGAVDVAEIEAAAVFTLGNAHAQFTGRSGLVQRRVRLQRGFTFCGSQEAGGA